MLDNQVFQDALQDKGHNFFYVIQSDLFVYAKYLVSDLNIPLALIYSNYIEVTCNLAYRRKDERFSQPFGIVRKLLIHAKGQIETERFLIAKEFDILLSESETLNRDYKNLNLPDFIYHDLMEFAQIYEEGKGLSREKVFFSFVKSTLGLATLFEPKNRGLLFTLVDHFYNRILKALKNCPDLDTIRILVSTYGEDILEMRDQKLVEAIDISTKK